MPPQGRGPLRHHLPPGPSPRPQDEARAPAAVPAVPRLGVLTAPAGHAGPAGILAPPLPGPSTTAPLAPGPLGHPRWSPPALARPGAAAPAGPPTTHAAREPDGRPGLASRGDPRCLSASRASIKLESRPPAASAQRRHTGSPCSSQREEHRVVTRFFRPPDHAEDCSHAGARGPAGEDATHPQGDTMLGATSTAGSIWISMEGARPGHPRVFGPCLASCFTLGEH
jgi:hypothetical protein